MCINGDGNWLNILNDAVITYNNNIHSAINMTPVDASNNPDKVKYTFSFSDYVRNVGKRNIFSKGYTSKWNRELFKVNEVPKTQPPTYKVGDINGEIIEGKYYEISFGIIKYRPPVLSLIIILSLSLIVRLIISLITRLIIILIICKQIKR